ncbi:MAG: hypothetical protein ACXACG_05770 [Candidatus Thorarchaeota archaeon]
MKKLNKVSLVKRLRVVALLVAFTVALVSVAPVEAIKPLGGTMDLQFNLGWPGPQDEVPDWVGNITIDGVLYDMAFYAIGSGKSFVTDPANLRGKIHFFEEIWVIGHIDYAFDENGVLTLFDPYDILMRGYDKGQTNTQNSKYHMSGYVEDATGAFTGRAGCNVHMMGDIIWYPFGAPFAAPGEFRLN